MANSLLMTLFSFIDPLYAFFLTAHEADSGDLSHLFARLQFLGDKPDWIYFAPRILGTHKAVVRSTGPSFVAGVVTFAAVRAHPVQYYGCYAAA